MVVGIDIRVLMDKQYSGVSQYAVNLLAALFDLDQTTEYRLFYNSWRPLDRDLPFKADSRIKIIRTAWPNKIFNYFGQRLFHYPKLDRLVGACDVFFSPHLNFSSLSAKTKSVLTIHDLSFLRYPEFFSGRKNFWHKALAIRPLVERADKIVAVSENTRQDLMTLFNLPPEKVITILSGLNELPRPEALETEAWLKAKDLVPGYILYLGNLEPRKNIVGLMKAYEDLRRTHPERMEKLVLAGATAWKTKDIERARRASSYKDDIRFLGYVSPQEKAILYARAGVFAYPSFYEGFGFPPLEAMSFGLPVITSNISSLPEVGGDAVLGVDPYDLPALSQALDSLLSDEQLKRELGSRGLERSRQFAWPTSAQKYLELFKSLA